MAGQFTGRHMAAILVCGFAVVIGVNFFMARAAVGTFGGTVVENSYVASQHFNRWLNEAEKERALGWSAALSRTADGRVALTTTGAPAGSAVRADARHPLGRLPDVRLDFAASGPNRYVSTAPLPAGRWILRIEVAGAGERWRVEETLR